MAHHHHHSGYSHTSGQSFSSGTGDFGRSSGLPQKSKGFLHNVMLGITFFFSKTRQRVFIRFILLLLSAAAVGYTLAKFNAHTNGVIFDRYVSQVASKQSEFWHDQAKHLSEVNKEILKHPLSHNLKWNGISGVWSGRAAPFPGPDVFPSLPAKKGPGPYDDADSYEYFLREGLRDKVWRDLNKLRSREIVLRPVIEPFVKEAEIADPVPWTSTPLMNPGAQRGWSSSNSWFNDVLSIGQNKIKNEHVIPTFPRVPVLSEKAPRMDALAFGLTTTVSRAREMGLLWANWMAAPNIRKHTLNEQRMRPIAEEDKAWEGQQPLCLVLLSQHERPDEIEDLIDFFDDMRLPCKIRQSPIERYETRVLSMVKELRSHAIQQKRDIQWFVMNDDDTFWTDPIALRRTLTKYNPDDLYFIGTVSEGEEQHGIFGRMAFGGAGILISRAMLNAMNEHWNDCHERFKNIFGGDEMLTRCAALSKGSDDMTVALTMEPSMHQFDIRGDGTGIFQSGLPFLSLHHEFSPEWIHIYGYGTYMSAHEILNTLSKAFKFLGMDNMMRRYVFGDGKWLLTMGYSITYFEEPLSPNDMARLEHTWYHEVPLIAQLPDRPVIPERHDTDGLPVKQTFYLEDVKVLNPGSAIFVYVQADKWDENIPREKRERIEVLWDGCWQKQSAQGCE